MLKVTINWLLQKYTKPLKLFTQLTKFSYMEYLTVNSGSEKFTPTNAIN